MAEASPRKYRAFLSYSHRDKTWGDWLHSALERYAIPRELKQGKFGALPAQLRPICRDREDLEAGHSLSAQVDAALSDSDALIVICSPASSKSVYVNEEIRRFKALGRGERVYAIIVAGEPGDAAEECFPAALRLRIDAQGNLTSEREEPIAADAREHADGKELALLKIAAGLLGVDLDELRKREAIAAKRRQRRTQLVAAFMALLALTAAAAAVYAQRQRNVAVEARNQALIARGQAETARDQADRARQEAVAARDLAERHRQDAERRYDQALNSTLRLVTTGATLRSMVDGTSFGISQIQSKAESNDFMEFLQTAKNRNDVWLRLTKVLMDYEHDLPPELARYQKRLSEAGLPLQWLQHAEVIMLNIVRGGGTQPEYKARLDELRRRILARGGKPARDCVVRADNALPNTAANAPAAQAPLANADPAPVQQSSPQAMRSLPPCE